MERGFLGCKKVTFVSIQMYLIHWLIWYIHVIVSANGTMTDCNITITIPSSLFERLEWVKDKMDVSDICKHAINAVVTIEEAKAVALSEIETTIARLKGEAKAILTEWYQKGRTQGLKLAPSLSLTEFHHVLMWHEERYFGFEEDEEESELVHIFEIVPYDSFLTRAIDIESCPYYVTDSYVLGALDGVVEIWNSIKSELGYPS